MQLGRLKQILSDKKISLVLVLLAIAARIALQLYFFDLSGDRSYQMVAAASFAGGHGFSIPQLAPGATGAPVYVPLAYWPPGYSLLLSPLYRVFGNMTTAALVLEILFSILFVVVSRKLLALAGVSAWRLSLYTLVAGFFIYDFAAASGSDFYSLIFFLMGLYCLLSFLKKGRPLSFALLAALALFMTAFTRYMYAPVVVLVVLYLPLAGWAAGNRRLIRGGMAAAGTLFLLLAGFYFYQYRFTGSAVYIAAPHKGWYPSHLLEINPFLITPFVNLELTCTALHLLFGFDYIREVEVLRAIHLVPLLVAGVYAARYLLLRFKTGKTTAGHYLYVGLLSSSAIVLLLLFLSLTNAPEQVNGNTVWTYVQEPRYYAFVVLFIQQAFFLCLPLPSKTAGRPWKIVAWAGAILLGLQVLHGLYFTTRKLATEGADFTQYKTWKGTRQFLDRSLDSLQRQHPAQNLVVLSSDPSCTNLAVLNGYKACYQPECVKNATVRKAWQGSVLLLILKEASLPTFQGLLPSAATKCIGAAGGYYFYVLEP